jgi:cytochrome P450
MAMDMVLSGIDTTGSTLSFLIYHLAKNKDKQNKLREEVNSFGGGPLTVQNIGVMKYFRACLQV